MTKHANIAIQNVHYGKNTGCFSKKFAQSLDTFGLILYLCTDISQGRTLLGGQAMLGSITFTSGAFVIFSSPFEITRLKNRTNGRILRKFRLNRPLRQYH
jgi:hypothetical protein